VAPPPIAKGACDISELSLLFLRLVLAYKPCVYLDLALAGVYSNTVGASLCYVQRRVEKFIC